MTTPAASAFVLTLTCADRPGIVHAVTGALAEQGANITEAQQFNDAGTGLFFMRVQFDAAAHPLAALQGALDPLRQRFGATHWSLAPAAERMRCAVLVSQFGHCLNDLLFRWRSGALPLELCCVVSNHREHEGLVASYGLPFHHIPVTAATKADAEATLVALLDAERIELVVLARYMQILSDGLCRRLAGRAINIHHSFLPSFKGAQPYRQAFERGVKIIGATAHYVTAELDEGPIIEQDIARGDHSHDPAELTAIGRDVECAVLARAVKWHAERRVLIDRNKTVVFR
jgi:formyltetrahydrofolate deformylase